MSGEQGRPAFGPPGRTIGQRPPLRPPKLDPAPKPDVSLLRISDSERQEFVDQLSRHCAEGRLTLEELDERIAAAWAARTQAELAPLAADLPLLAPAKKPEPDFKAWLADGKALLMALPSRLLIAGAAGVALVLILLVALVAAPFGGHGFNPH